MTEEQETDMENRESNTENRNSTENRNNNTENSRRKGLMEDIIIRNAAAQDLEAVTAVEAACFLAAEAADKKSLKERLEAFPESFFVAERAGRIIGFINGAVTDERTIADEMFENISLHDPEGAYQCIFGLDVVEEYRHMGLASRLMETMIKAAEERGKKGLILTCKDRLIGYYERFGYVNCGLSKSVHGGAVWYDMILEF